MAINNISMKDGIMLHTHTHIYHFPDLDVNVDVLTTFVHKSYILIHLVCQSVTRLGKGRAGHGLGTGTGGAGHGHGRDWARIGHDHGRD